MTREIKFRGKDFLGRWHYGHLHLATGSSSLMIQVDSFDSFGVLPETIGQFTGLLDKNGKEIYEGDIVLSKLKRARKYDERLVICFDYFEWQGKDANGTTTSLSLLFEYHTVEVIGNIHDNPELLKGE